MSSASPVFENLKGKIMAKKNQEVEAESEAEKGVEETPVIFVSNAKHLVLVGESGKVYDFKNNTFVGFYVTTVPDEIKELRKMQTQRAYMHHFHEADHVPNGAETIARVGPRRSVNPEIAPGVKLKEEEPKEVTQIREEAHAKAKAAGELRPKE